MWFLRYVSGQIYRQTDRQTHRHDDQNTSAIYWGKVTTLARVITMWKRFFRMCRSMPGNVGRSRSWTLDGQPLYLRSRSKSLMYWNQKFRHNTHWMVSIKKQTHIHMQHFIFHRTRFTDYPWLTSCIWGRRQVGSQHYSKISRSSW